MPSACPGACTPFSHGMLGEEEEEWKVTDRDHSGLTYTPGMYAATSELAVLCKMLAEEYPGAYYAPHHRGYGVNALGNYDEMLQLGRVTGCPVRECWFFRRIFPVLFYSALRKP